MPLSLQSQLSWLGYGQKGIAHTPHPLLRGIPRISGGELAYRKGRRGFAPFSYVGPLARLPPPKFQRAGNEKTRVTPTHPALQWNVVVFLARGLNMLVAEHGERPRHALARLGRFDHLVDIAALGCNEG